MKLVTDPSSARFKNVWSYYGHSPIRLYVFHTDNCIFSFTVLTLQIVYLSASFCVLLPMVCIFYYECLQTSLKFLLPVRAKFIKLSFQFRTIPLRRTLFLTFQARPYIKPFAIFKNSIFSHSIHSFHIFTVRICADHVRKYVPTMFVNTDWYL
jgi:hypothetical protein